jgi:hypothetical protein
VRRDREREREGERERDAKVSKVAGGIGKRDRELTLITEIGLKYSKTVCYIYVCVYVCCCWVKSGRCEEPNVSHGSMQREYACMWYTPTYTKITSSIYVLEAWACMI